MESQQDGVMPELVDRLKSELFLPRLYEKFGDPPPRGGKIAVAEIEAVLGHNDLAPKTQTILQHWRRVLKEEHGLVTTRRGGFLHVLTYEEQYANGRRKITLSAAGFEEGVSRIEPTLGQLPETQNTQAEAIVQTYAQTWRKGFMQFAQLAEARRQRVQPQLPP